MYHHQSYLMLNYVSLCQIDYNRHLHVPLLIFLALLVSDSSPCSCNQLVQALASFMQVPNDRSEHTVHLSPSSLELL